jgi:hypothetical protein
MKQTTNNTVDASEAAVFAPTFVVHDFKNAILIVSVVVNLIIFTAWVALQVTTKFDAQFANLLFNR